MKLSSSVSSESKNTIMVPRWQYGSSFPRQMISPGACSSSFGCSCSCSCGATAKISK